MRYVSPARVATRYLVAGTIQVPPRMYENAQRWVWGVLAATRMNILNETLSTVEGMIQERVEAKANLERVIKSLHQAIAANKPKTAWGIYRTVFTLVTRIRPEITKYAEFSGAMVAGVLSDMVENEMADLVHTVVQPLEELQRKLVFVQEHAAKLNPDLRSDAHKIDGDPAVLDLAFDTAGWAYTKFSNLEEHLPKLVEKHRDFLGPLADMVKLEGEDGVARGVEESVAHLVKLWKTIRIEVLPEWSSAGSWEGAKRIIRVRVPDSVFFPGDIGFLWDRVKQDVSEILHHEMQHMVQTYIGTALHGFALSLEKTPAGGPPAKIRTPGYSQHNRDVRQLERDDIPEGVRKPTTIHMMDDVEFHTRLSDAKRLLEDVLKRHPKLNPRRVLAIFVGDEPRVRDPKDPYSYVIPNEFVTTLRRIPEAQGKYRRILSELSRAVV